MLVAQLLLVFSWVTTIPTQKPSLWWLDSSTTNLIELLQGPTYLI
jgi:hypothetical protein